MKKEEFQNTALIRKLKEGYGITPVYYPEHLDKLKNYAQKGFSRVKFIYQFHKEHFLIISGHDPPDPEKRPGDLFIFVTNIKEIHGAETSEDFLMQRCLELILDTYEFYSCKTRLLFDEQNKTWVPYGGKTR